MPFRHYGGRLLFGSDDAWLGFVIYATYLSKVRLRQTREMPSPFTPWYHLPVDHMRHMYRLLDLWDQIPLLVFFPMDTTTDTRFVIRSEVPKGLHPLSSPVLISSLVCYKKQAFAPFDIYRPRRYSLFPTHLIHFLLIRTQ